MIRTMVGEWLVERRRRRDEISLAEKTKRRARRIILTVLALMAFVCLACLFTGVFVGRVSAHALETGDRVVAMDAGVRSAEAVPGQDPGTVPPVIASIDVVLVIDNSNSMFDKDGVGSDPEQRRIEGAHLFIHSLGVDSATADHRLSVITFGGTASTVVPLTLLDSAARRQAIADRIAQPERMDWTNPAAALSLARTTLSETGGSGRRRVVVLLTDGKPEWPRGTAGRDQNAVSAELAAIGRAYAEEELTLYVVLLSNDTTEADPEIFEVYVPLWHEMTESTGGHFYAVRDAEDFIEVYHDVLLSLSGMASAGAVVQATVAHEREIYPIPIEPGLAQVNLTIWMSEMGHGPTALHSGVPNGVAITLQRPDGRKLTAEDDAVRYSGSGTTEVWAIDEPQSGNWSVVIEGEGAVAIWKDTLPEPATPTPVPTPTAAPTLRPTPTPAPTMTPSPTPTATPVPEWVVENWPAAARVGTPITLTARIAPLPEGSTQLSVTWMTAGEVVTREQLFDDGRMGDLQAEDGRYTVVIVPQEVGTLSVELSGEIDGMALTSWRGRVQVDATPRLVAVEPGDVDVWHVGEEERVLAEWRVGDAALQAGGPLTVTLEGEPGAWVDRVWLGQVGQPITVTAPSARRTYTVTLRASGVTPQGLLYADTLTMQVWVRRHIPSWVYGACTLGTLAVVAGAVTAIWLRHQPILTGKLRVLRAPPAYSGPEVMDLSDARRTRATLGGQGSLLEGLQNQAHWATLTVSSDGSGVQLTPAAGAEVRLRHSRITTGYELKDLDVIETSSVRLRYECFG